MKKIFFAAYFLLFYITSNQINTFHKINTPAKNQAFYKTSIESPESLEISSALGGIYYNGEKLTLEDSTFMLQEDPNANIFNIIFTESACAKFEESYTPTTRISHIKTKKDAKSRYFHLSRKPSFNKDNDQEWKISEVSIKKSFKIPLDHTIIILMNPSHLANEPNKVFKSTKPGKSKAVISLPTIVLHHLLDKEEEKTKSTIAQLSAIDLNTLHTKTKKQNPTVVTYKKSQSNENSWY